MSNSPMILIWILAAVVGTVTAQLLAGTGVAYAAGYLIGTVSVVAYQKLIQD